MNKPFEFSPKSFVDLFILCLSWQWEPGKFASEATTVDAVTRTLCGLGVVTDPQIRELHTPPTGKLYQTALLEQCATIRVQPKLWDDRDATTGLTATNREILRQTRPLCIALHGAMPNPDRSRFLHDRRIHITLAGVAHARDHLADRYAPWITPAAYLAERGRQAILQEKEGAKPTRASKRGTGPTISLPPRLW